MVEDPYGFDKSAFERAYDAIAAALREALSMRGGLKTSVPKKRVPASLPVDGEAVGYNVNGHTPTGG